jgi:hypothetical protein
MTKNNNNISNIYIYMSVRYYKIKIEAKPKYIIPGVTDTVREGVIHASTNDEIKNGLYSLLFDLYVDDTVITKLAEVGSGLYNNAIIYSFSIKFSILSDTTSINITISTP